MNKSYKIKINPTDSQIKKFYKTWSGYVTAFNWAVEQQIQNFDSELIRRETTDDKQALFIHKYQLSNNWTQYKKSLKKSIIGDPEAEQRRQQILDRVTGISAFTLVQALFDACVACERFFENSKNNWGLRSSKKKIEPLFTNKENQSVYSLRYRVAGPRFKSFTKNYPAFPVNLQNLRITARNIYVSQLETGKGLKGQQDKIQLLERGRIPFNHDKPLKYSNPRITFDGIDWWFSIGVELPDIQCKVNPGLVIGVDPGSSSETLATLDNGEVFTNHISFREYKRREAQYKKLEKALCKKRERIKKLNGGKFVSSTNYERLKLRYLKAFRKFQNIKNYNRHNVSRSIVSRNPELIGLETLNMAQLLSDWTTTEKRTKKDCRITHRNLAASGMYELQRQIEYKAGWRGIKVQKVDQFFPSTQLCSKCGYKIGKLPTTVRDWTCPECGTHHDRDVNAAINIRNEAIRLDGLGAGRPKKKRTTKKKKEETN